MIHESIPPEFSRPIHVDRLGPGETKIEIAAEPHELKALAGRFDLLALDSLAATVRLRPMPGSRLVRLKAHFTADAVQACVVTLEPLPVQVAECIELMFAPAGDDDDVVEVSFAYDDADPPEPIRNGHIDIGEVVAEHLALALDPFPRAPGASFAPEVGASDDSGDADKPSPFAALAALKKKER